MKHHLILLFVLCFTLSSLAQEKLKWYEPDFVEGICLSDSTNIFHRLPANMKDKVRPAVWDLSNNTAGEFIHFKTSAREIKVRYIVSDKNFALPHMPATGKSGVDLYAIDKDGQWNWAPGKYSFGDTCSYTFSNLSPAKNSSGITDFYLYLPLYNSVEWLALGVDATTRFSFAAKRKEKPIVAYGTSILQGGVASRPGLAWTNILARNMDRTIINLGFSGNGRYEAPIFDLMAKVEAQLYILDCMPNLTAGFSAADIKERLIYGISKLREKNEHVPLLFVEHAAGYSSFYMDTARLNNYHKSSLVIAGLFDQLKSSGIKNIYLLTEKEIDFDINSTTDGLHPNDIGMLKYALAYEKKIREILSEPKGNISTQIPQQQYRDGYNWIKRHEDIIENIQMTNPDILLVGNSIINFFGGKPAGMVIRGEVAWQQYLAPLKFQNSGYGWDRIENVLWRVYHGELDNFKGKNIILMIGTNNLGLNSEEEIVSGLAFLLQAIRSRRPDAKITMAGILPRKNNENAVKNINLKIQKMALEKDVTYRDFGKHFLRGKAINASLFENDGLHPNEKGYEVLGKSLQEFINNSL